MRSDSVVERESQSLTATSARLLELQGFGHHHVTTWHERHIDDAAHTSSAIAPIAAPLPGIATLFQQPSHRHHQRYHSHHDTYRRNHHSSEPHESHHSSEPHENHHTATTAASFSHLLSMSHTTVCTRACDVKSRHAHTPSHPALSDAAARGSSPGLDALKHMGIGSMRAPHRLNPGSSPANASHAASINGGDGAARMHTSYKHKASGSGTLHHRPVRTSRYLREVDRRNILRRIECGEKQADLAKEYQVSRAAISNLKQRRSRKSNQHGDDDVPTTASATGQGDRGSSNSDLHDQYDHPQQKQSSLEQRSPERAGMIGDSCETAEHHRRQYARHHYNSDGEQMSSASASPSSSSSSSPSAAVGSSPHIVTVRAREQLELRRLTMPSRERVVELGASVREVLFARLIDQDTDARLLQASVMRIARLLLEHAMGLFPTSPTEILPAAHSHNSTLLYTGVAPVKSVCAVAVTERAAALLHEFQVIEPQCEIGYVSFASSLPPVSPSSASSTEDGVAVQLPRSVHASSVLMLDLLCSHCSIQELAIAIKAVLRAGAQQEDVCIVSMSSHESALAHLLEWFPRVRVMTAKLLPTTPEVHGVRADQCSSDDVMEWLYSRLVR